MSQVSELLSKYREELAAQDHAFREAVVAMGFSSEDLDRCDLDLDEAIVEGFWGDVFGLPAPHRSAARIDPCIATLRA